MNNIEKLYLISIARLFYRDDEYNEYYPMLKLGK